MLPYVAYYAVDSYLLFIMLNSTQVLLYVLSILLKKKHNIYNCAFFVSVLSITSSPSPSPLLGSSTSYSKITYYASLPMLPNVANY